MEKLINDKIAEQVIQVFSGMQNPVEILFFEKKNECDYCPDTRQLLEEVAGLSEKIGLQTFDLEEDEQAARQYHVDQAPAFVIVSRTGDQLIDYGIRFLGIPSGHEFTSLINDLVMVSNRETGLSQPTREYLKSLTQPVKLQVFTTPTCPYCPRAVVLAHQMALESEWVEAEMVDAIEFGELADRFDVNGVPQTTINDGAWHVIGAVPEDHLVGEIKQALGVNSEL